MQATGSPTCTPARHACNWLAGRHAAHAVCRVRNFEGSACKGDGWGNAQPALSVLGHSGNHAHRFKPRIKGQSSLRLLNRVVVPAGSLPDCCAK